MIAADQSVRAKGHVGDEGLLNHDSTRRKNKRELKEEQKMSKPKKLTQFRPVLNEDDLKRRPGCTKGKIPQTVACYTEQTIGRINTWQKEITDIEA